MNPWDHDPRFHLAEARYLANLECMFPEDIFAPDEGPDPDEEYKRQRDREELHGAGGRCANCRWVRGE